jgi:hypothetical protein
MDHLGWRLDGLAAAGERTRGIERRVGSNRERGRSAGEGDQGEEECRDGDDDSACRDHDGDLSVACRMSRQEGGFVTAVGVMLGGERVRSFKSWEDLEVLGAASTSESAAPAAPTSGKRLWMSLSMS